MDVYAVRGLGLSENPNINPAIKQQNFASYVYLIARFALYIVSWEELNKIGIHENRGRLR